MWSSEDLELDGRTLSRRLSAEACQCGHRDDLNRVQSAAFQKERARQVAFINWSAEWSIQSTQRGYSGGRGVQPPDFGDETWVRTHLPPPQGNPLLRLRTDSHPSPKWGTPSALASGHGEGERRQGPLNRTPLYSRRTTSTALQLAVDHAFTGTYVVRFRPGDPEEASACPGGAKVFVDGH